MYITGQRNVTRLLVGLAQPMSKRACEYPGCFRIDSKANMFRLEYGEWLCMEHAHAILKDKPTPSQRYKLAHAAGQDAGNRSMRAGGRKAWDDSDFDVAVETFNKAFGLPQP